MTDHDKMIMAPKIGSKKDRDVLAEYAESHWFCALCGKEWDRLQIHHIIGGRMGRSDEHCNLLRCCHSPCHPFCDLAKNLGVVLTAKARAGELTEDARARLTVLHGRVLPELQPIPQLFQDLYRLYRGGDE